MCCCYCVCVCHLRLHSACSLNVIEELEPEMQGLVTWEASSARMGGGGDQGNSNRLNETRNALC